MSNLLVSSFSFAEIFGNISTEWYLYVALGACLWFMFLAFALYNEPPRMKLTSTQNICHVAIFTAICAVVNALTFFPVSYISISFVATVCALAGFLYGPKNAFIVGFVGDLITAIIFPAGPYNPLIGLASGLMGMIPGLVFRKTGNIYIKVALSAILTLSICTCGINTLGLWLVYGIGKKTFFAYLFARLPFQIIMGAVNAMITVIIMRVLIHVLPKNQFRF